jgi:lysyl-tRNA synthetase class 2
VSPPQENHEASRLEKLRAIEALGLDPWGGRFDGHQPIADVRELKPDAEPPTKVTIAGRIVLRRTMGNLHFLTVWDWTGRIQVGISKKNVSPTAWALAQQLDLGDLIGVKGWLGNTKTGELTVWAEELTFLGKSLCPHPDKHAGMQDMEFRLRHRYLDLIYNQETLDRARKRILIVRTIRRFLDDKGFCEVETPTLHAIAGGAAARPFVTHHNTLDIDLFLRIALELHLKRLLVGGMEKVYEIGRVFRNEGISTRHNPEFTMMELYQAYADYRSMMDLTEGMIVACVDALGGGRRLSYGERSIDFTPPFPRRSYADLFREHVGVAIDDDAAVRAVAPNRNVAVTAATTGTPIHHDVIVHHLFEACVEPRLADSDRPVFVHDYPAGLCPLTKRQRGNPTVAERFELYVLGMELANAYTELNDPITQEQTFRSQLAGLSEEDSMAKMDDDFVRALRHGMPPAGGLGVGVDRLVMLLTNTTTIRDVILFPLLRPERSEPV